MKFGKWAEGVYFCTPFCHIIRKPINMITQEQLKETEERKLALRRYL